MGIIATKPVFRVSDKMRFKPACSATETSQKIEISLVTYPDMIFSKRRIKKGQSDCVVAQAGLRLCFSQTPEYRFSLGRDPN